MFLCQTDVIGNMQSGHWVDKVQVLYFILLESICIEINCLSQSTVNHCDHFIGIVLLTCKKLRRGGEGGGGK